MVSKSTLPEDRVQISHGAGTPVEDAEEVSSHIGQGVEFARKAYTYARENKRRVGLITTTVVVILLLPSFFLQNIVNTTEIDVLGIKLVDATDDYLEMELTLDIRSSSVLDGQHSTIDLSLYYNGTEVGTAVVSPAQIKAGHSVITSKNRFYPDNMAAFDEMSRALFTQDNIKVHVRGIISAGLSGPIGIARTFAVMDKDVYIPGIPPLDINVRNIYVTDVQSDTMNLHTFVEINNTAPFSIDLDKVNLDVLYDGEIVGTFGNEGLKLVPGLNMMETNIHSMPGSEEVNAQVFKKILEGHDVTLQMRGSYRTRSLIDRTLRQMVTESTLPGLKNMTISMESMDINGWNDTSFFIGSTLHIINPSPVGGDIRNVTFGIRYNDTLIGTFRIAQLVFGPGESDVHVNTTLTPTGPAAMAPMLRCIIEGQNTTFNLVGLKDAPDFLSRVMSNASVEVSIPGDGHGTVISLEDIRLLSTGPNTIQFSSEGIINNTSPLEGHMSNFSMEVVYDGGSVGTLYTPSLDIARGVKNVSSSLTMDFSPGHNNLSNAQWFFADYLAGKINTVTVRGAPGGTDILSRSFQYINIPVSMGAGNISISIGKMNVTSIEGQKIISDSSLIIDNPTRFTGALGNLTLMGSYKGMKFGSIKSPLILSPGRNEINVTTVMDVENPEPLGHVVSDMMMGDNVTLEISGREGGNVLERLMARSKIPLKLADGNPAGVVVDAVTIRNTTNTSTTLRVVSHLYNPTAINMELDPLDLAFFYNGTKIGSFTSKPRMLSPGMGEWIDDVPIDASSEDVKNALSKMTARNIEGHAVYLTMTGAGSLNPDTTARSKEALIQQIIDNSNIICEMPEATGGPDIVIDSLELYGTVPESQGLNMRVRMLVANPTAVGGDIEDAWMMARYDNRDIGRIYMKSLPLSSGNSTISVDTILYPNAPPVFSDMVDNISKGNVADMVFSGLNGVNLVSDIMSNVKLSTSIAGNEGISVTVDEFTVLENNKDNLTLWIASTVHNPSVLKAKLDLFNFTVNYLGVPVGYLVPVTQWLEPGDNKLEGKLVFLSDNIEAARELVSSVMSGEGVTIELTGRFKDVMNQYDVLRLLVPMETDGAFQMYTKLTRVTDGGPNILNCEITYSIYNPTPFHGRFPKLNFLSAYMGQDFGVFMPRNMSLTKGWNNMTVQTDMRPLDVGVFTDLTSEQLHGHDVITTISGYDEADDMFSRMISSWKTQVTLESDDPIAVDLTDYRFLSSTDTEMVIQLKGTLTNPTFMTAAPLRLNGTLFYKGHYLGHIATDKMGLERGQNILDITATLTDVDSDLGAQMTATYLHGGDMPLRIYSGLSSDGTCFKFFNLDITVPASGQEMTIDLDGMNIVQTTDDQMNAQISVTVNNPTIIWGTFGDLAFDTYHDGIFAGTVFTGDFQVKKGAQSITIDGVIDTSDPQVYTDIINTLFSGEDVEIECRSSNRSSKLMQAFMKDYEYTVYIRSYGNIEITIENMWIMDGYDNTLVLGVNSSIFNPTTMEADLNTLYFNMYYSGVKVGELQFAPMHMVQWYNDVTSIAYLNGPSDSIREILSNYLAGNDTDLLVKGNPDIDNGVIGDVLKNFTQTIVMEGINDPLVLAAYIDNVQLDVLGAGFSCDFRAVVQNPSTFEFNITRVDASVYYNDNDPSSLMGSTYPPKDHIYLSDIHLEYNPYMHMRPGDVLNVSSSIHNNDWENDVRLYDEYVNDHDLTVDTVGTITINVGTFYTDIDFSAYKVPVY